MSISGTAPVRTLEVSGFDFSPTHIQLDDETHTTFAVFTLSPTTNLSGVNEGAIFLGCLTQTPANHLLTIQRFEISLEWVLTLLYRLLRCAILARRFLMGIFSSVFCPSWRTREKVVLETRTL